MTDRPPSERPAAGRPGSRRARIGGHQVGLPAGVVLAPLGRRLAAYAIDGLVPYVALLIGTIALLAGGPGWLALILFIVGVGWLAALCWLVGTRAAGIGMRLLGLQVVGMHDGRPIGPVRALLRGVIIGAMTATGFGLVIMSTMMLLQIRRQGWHDRAVDSVVIEERPLAPAGPRRQSSRQSPRRAPKPQPAPQTLPTRIDLVEEPDAWDSPEQPGASQTATPALAPAPQRAAVETDAGADRATDRDVDHQPDRPAPAAEQADASATPDVRADETATADEEDAPLPPDQGWLVVLEDGREIPISRLILVGRNPQPRAGEEDARLIKVVDEARTVSKTHLAINVDSRGVLVTDRGSTNGSAITGADGRYLLLTPHEPQRVPMQGCLVAFGKHQIRIARRRS